jgi:hypothetical protein
MDTAPTYGLQELLTHVVGDMARSVAVRVGESEQQRLARAHYAAQTILAFLPTDAIEAMIAGHCVMFHEMIVDTVQTALRGEMDATRRATRNSIVAMDKAFGNNLIRLRQHRAGLAEAAAEAFPADTLAETEIADRVRRHQPDARTEAASPEPANVPHPNQPPAAADPMAGLNRQARRAIFRQNGKRHVPTAPTAARASGSGASGGQAHAAGPHIPGIAVGE